MNRRDGMPKVRVTEENLVALPALAPYFAFGLLAFIATPFLLGVGTKALDGGLYRHPYILASLHSGVLAWGTSVALGALQQMTAVVGATRLHSSRLATAAFVPFILGTIGLIWGFFSLSPVALNLATLGVPLGVGLIVFNVLRTAQTAQNTRRWLIIEPFVKGALLYIFLAFFAGAALAFNLARGQLVGLWADLFPFHIGGAVVGWFFMLVTGISYHMLTFFGLVDKGTNFIFPKTIRGLVHAGLLAGVIGSLLHRIGPGPDGTGSAVVLSIANALRVGALLGFAGAGGLFVWDTRGLYIRPPRQRTSAVHTYVRIGHGYLAVASVAVIILWTTGGFDGVHFIALGVLLGAGWLSNTILGYLHRILAFFVWHNKYWGRGREPGVPAFRDMVNPGPASFGLLLFNVGVVGVVVTLYCSVSVQWAIVPWTVGALLIGVNLVRTMLR